VRASVTVTPFRISFRIDYDPAHPSHLNDFSWFYETAAVRHLLCSKALAPLKPHQRKNMEKRQEMMEPPTAPEGRYANHFDVGHNAIEFLLDFGQYFSDERALLHTRIIINPVVAKAFKTILTRAVSEFEKEFGSIGGPTGAERRKHKNDR
jgi:hypothetical protein